jgi:hypothetical protein
VTQFCRSTLTFLPGSSWMECGRQRSTAGERVEHLMGEGAERVVRRKLSMSVRGERELERESEVRAAEHF